MVRAGVRTFSIIVAFLCGLAYKANAGGVHQAEHSQGLSSGQRGRHGPSTHLERRAHGSLSDVKQWSNCTAQWPAVLKPIGLPRVCAEVDSPSAPTDHCSPNRTLGVKFEGHSDYLFKREISLVGSDVTCASVARGSPLANLCGEGVHLCVDFVRCVPRQLSATVPVIASCLFLWRRVA
jgi:hypothetical protein